MLVANAKTAYLVSEGQRVIEDSTVFPVNQGQGGLRENVDSSAKPVQTVYPDRLEDLALQCVQSLFIRFITYQNK